MIYEARILIEAKAQKEAADKIRAALEQVGKVIGMGVAKRGEDADDADS